MRTSGIPSRLLLAVIGLVGCVDRDPVDAPHQPVLLVNEPDLSSDLVDMSSAAREDALDASPDLADMSHAVLDERPLYGPIAGRATVNARSDLPFATLIQDLSLESFQAASRGREFFVADWEPPGSGRELLDGLGPLFHVPSCQGCHPAAGRPPTFLPGGSIGPGILFRLRDSSGGGDDAYGGQLQPRALAGIAPEATPRWYARAPGEEPGASGEPRAPRVALGQELVVVFEERGYGDFEEGILIGPRLSPHLTGMGLLDHVPVEDLIAMEDPEDEDGDGISGRIHWLEDNSGARVVGRYGWKSNAATLREQVAGAFMGDMGLTSPLKTRDDCTPLQNACIEAAGSDEPEVSDSGLDAVVAYLQLLGVPARRSLDPVREERGYERFIAAGCGACHAPTLRTEDFDDMSVLSGQVIHPFSDLLLHDMGENLGDGVPDGDATGREWRTPPLWGIGRVADQPHARFLHDGRAATLHDAIRMHGGEGARSAANYNALTEAERGDLLVFLRSL